MLKFFDRYKKLIIPCSGVILFLMTGALAMLLTSSKTPKVAKTQEQTQAVSQVQAVPVNHEASESTPQVPQTPAPEIHEDWFVYVTGAVSKPGVYKLPENPRVFHAIESAGGMTQNADKTGINLAEKILTDGMHIHIETLDEKAKREKQETAKLAAQNVQRSVQPAGVKTPEVIRVPGIPVKTQTQTQNQNQRNSQQAGSNLVDVNHASEQELTRLKGVGPAIAKRIVDFRTNMGPFRTPEDLLQIRGIGTKTLEKMRPQLLLR